MGTKKPVGGVNGKIERVVGNSLAYLVTHDGKSLSFTPDKITDYRGETFAKLGLVESAGVHFTLRSSGIIKEVSLLKRKINDETDGPFVEARIRANRQIAATVGVRQQQLLPNDSAQGSIVPLRCLPAKTIRFGKLIDTSDLLPGDLLLSREVRHNDFVSRKIENMQRQGGYDPIHARWCHAAMYLGDDENVIEATLDPIPVTGNVRITSLDDYATGDSAVRFRRPKHISKKDRWKLCVRALSKLNKPYSFDDIAKMFVNISVYGMTFASENLRRQCSPRLICSTLYADSFAEATGRTLGEKNGVCVPAMLSLCPDFDELTVNWKKITA